MTNDNIKDLKSQAYDCVVNIEYWQGQLQAINKQIMEKSQPVAEPAEPVKVKEETKK